MNKDEIIVFLKENKPYIEQQFGVVRIGLFGSYVRGNAHEDSDIDIAVEMRDEHIFRNFFSLERYLKEHLKKEIDLGIMETIKPLVRQRVLKEIIYV
uniref:Polymerase nucleotidyl transferase domain-containing protein n=1 Tax=Desulfatirhabdium butyrativorans TaxID=340467 RepID=A0A7C4VRS0_9BACT